MLYGRDEERARIGALLEQARASRSSALVLRGEPGIGKSALLEDTRDRVADMQVLWARGVETESELPFAALHQLIRPGLNLIERLPAPQAAALRGALGLDEDGADERFLVFSGCLSLLSELAERRPVLCLVDDAQWLDAASADALMFIARRIDAEGIVMLFAVREGDIREFEAPGIPSLALEGLDVTAATSVLARGAGVDAAPAVRDRLLEQTRGNALALLELPSMLTARQLAGDEQLPVALPMPERLEEVFLERVRRLPETTQKMLVVAAADDSGDLAVVTRAAAELEIGADALDFAEMNDLVSVHGRRLEFRHPLVRSAVYDAALSSERRAAHRALADALSGDVENADRRAWHLAASALGYDEAVVCALDEAAARAEGRAAYEPAATALERAAELSQEDHDRGRRLAGAARCASVAGNDARAVALARRASALVDDSSVRAELAEVHGLWAIRSGRPRDVVSVLVEAARGVASTDPAKAVELLMDASVAVWVGGDMEEFLDVTRIAVTVVPPADDETATQVARSMAGFAAFLGGDTTEGARLLSQVVAWGATADTPRHVLWASYVAFWLADAKQFALLTDRAVSLSRERGELGNLAETLGIGAVRLALEQRLDDATVAASEADQLAHELGAGNLELLPRAALAVVAAVRGHDEEVRLRCEGVLERANTNGLRLRASAAVYALALLDLGRGRWSDAVDRLDSLLEGESGISAAFPDKIEAAVRAGRLDDAQAALGVLEARVAYSGDPSARPRLASCRALLAEGDEASAQFEEALRLRTDARPLDLARIHLLYGEHLRRERRRVDARVQLRLALEGFERLRAEPWSDRARTELRASGETARKRDPSTIDELTPQELQIARYVAEGLSNKEVAAQLFLSPRTIDSHLRRVFAKLGITSRTQLARMQLTPEAA